jgi:uncharacterized protein YaaQ
MKTFNKKYLSKQTTVMESETDRHLDNLKWIISQANMRKDERKAAYSELAGIEQNLRQYVVYINSKVS